MKKIITLLMALTMAATMLVGCAPAQKQNSGGNTAKGDESLNYIKNKKELVIGLDATFAPMGFTDEKGEIVGFDIDLAKAVCSEMGVTAKFQPISWDAKEMELDTKRIDCIWNGMSITTERKEKMELSNPYLNNKIIVMTNKGISIKSKDELKNFNIGTQAKSSALEVIEADPIYASFKGKVTQYPTYDECIMDMQTGRIDAMIVDEVLGKYKNAKMNNAFDVMQWNFGDDMYAIGFRKNEKALCEAVNAAIKKASDDGKAVEVSKKWFGEDLVIRK